MRASERRRQIRELLERDGRVDVGALHTRFRVSEMTIRRDLAWLEVRGYAVRTYGGAVAARGSTAEPSYRAKLGDRRAEKQAIARAAAELIEDGEAVLLDAGTTTGAMLPYLRSRKLTVITNAPEFVSALLDAPAVTLILIGGVVRARSVACVGSLATDALSKLSPDVCVLGVDGLDPERGLTIPDPVEAEIKRAMLLASRRRIVVADSSKLGHRSLVSFGGI
ncbi:MAG: DeoR/GlpR transcriptional regulator [Firmicutes bacterium]|nr:DeoR/GlpR transcriptional regulator [Bacillota bacterium]